MRRSPLVILLLSLAASTAATGAESPAATQPLQTQPAHTRSAPGPFARQLALECDELIALATKRPYGWAWHDPATDDAVGPATQPAQQGAPALPAASKNKTVTIAVPASARAGLILWLAGDILGEKRYHDAARNVARGIAATQTPSGKFPQQAYFGPGVTAREPLGQLPERSSTHAALALLLNTLDNQSDTAEQLQRSTIRGTTWLRKQQADSGAWSALYPEGVPIHKQTRLARLDTPDFRDSTVAMLLAAEVLADPLCRRAAEKSLEFLDKTRTAANAPTSTWGSAYTLSALAPTGLAEFPAGTDILATRHAIQTSLWCYLVLGNGQNIIRAQKAARSLEELPHDQGWVRRYTPHGDIYTPPAPATRPAATTRESEPWPPAADEPLPDLGVQSLLRTVQELDQLRREKALPRLASSLPLRQLLAVQAAGLNDGSIPLDFPASADQVPAYLAAHKAQFDRASEPKPRQFSDQIVRLWPIYLRALLEAQRGA